MKKVIILLTLALGIKVNAQIVGGFVPLNSTKTPTMAGIRVTGTTNKIGNTTLITSNTTTLTSGATSGTVAVLSDATTFISTTGAAGNPADASSYYIGNCNTNYASTQGSARIYLPYNYRVVSATINFYVGSTLGSAETASVYINIDNTPTLLSSAVTSTAITNNFNVTGLAININAGSYIETKVVTPTWVTQNPLAVTIGVTYCLERRQ